MSLQRISYEVRHALWLAHTQRCGYCSEPLSFAEVDIDHIIPESARQRPDLSNFLSGLNLPNDFDLGWIKNLLPAHRRCNLAKGADVLNESSIRFYLHKAERVSANVLKMLASQKARNQREELLLAVADAIRGGLIMPMDLQEEQRPGRMALSKSLRFADRPDEPVESISPEEVETYLDRPVLIGGNPIFFAEFGDDDGVRMAVRTCREYRAALSAGFYARTPYDIKSEAFLKTANAVLMAAATVRTPLVSYIRRPHRGLADLELLPAQILPCVSPDDAEIVNRWKDTCLADLLTRGDIKVLRISSSEVSLEWRWGLLVREICRADFDGDGIEDVLCECYCWALGGTMGYGWTSVLSCTGEEAMFVVSDL